MTITLHQATIQISLFPNVSDLQGHYGRRDAAALAFKTAAFLAEDAEAVVTQQSTVSPCPGLGRPTTIVIADYPTRPLTFEAVCPGFQSVFLGSG